MSEPLRQRGFTLIEVLVALIIVAFGMGALMATLASSAETTSHLREKSVAEWVALNRISEIRLRGAAPSTGKTTGDADFAGQKWRWTQEVVDPGIAGILRIDVSVVHADGIDDSKAAPVIAQASGFYGLSQAQPSGIEPDWSLWSLAGTASGTGAPATSVTPTTVPSSGTTTTTTGTTSTTAPAGTSTQ
jgi:general secretion pathway protein I